MKLKELESHLQEVSQFREPNVMLEQYPTVRRACASRPAPEALSITPLTLVLPVR